MCITLVKVSVLLRACDEEVEVEEEGRREGVMHEEEEEKGIQRKPERVRDHRKGREKEWGEETK